MTWGKLRIHPGFFLLLAVMFLLDTGGLLFWIGWAALLHEGGHLFALYLCGGQLDRLELSLLGCNLVVKSGLSYPKDLLCCLAGPVASVIGAGAAGRMGLYALAGFSLTLGLFNLLPLPTLDGGRLVVLFLQWRWASRYLWIADTVALTCAAAISGWGLVLFIRTRYNITLLVSGIYALLNVTGGCYVRKNRIHSARQIGRAHV